MGYRYALFQINATHCDACFGTVNLVVSVESVWSTITPALAIFFSLLVQFDELVLKLTSSADERIMKVDHYYQVLTQNIFRSNRTLSIEQFASNKTKYNICTILLKKNLF